jgi:S-adenosylmethionine uptake transporter
MMLGMFLFAGADTIAKVLTADFHPVQIAWTRMMGLVIAVIFLLATNGLQVLKTNSPFLQICRGAVAVCSATLFIVAVTYVPLADAIAVSFVAPFMVTLLGAWVLKERVGRRRWIAICIGFLATLIILRPGTGTVHPAAALILVAALFFALRQIISRVLGGTDKTATTITYTALVAGILLSLPLPFFWETPTQSRELLLFLGLAVLAGTGELLVIKSLEVAQAVVLAPVHYSLIVWGTFYGWMVFQQLPDLWTFVGALIIVATGIYTIRREMQVKRQAHDQT